MGLPVNVTELLNGHTVEWDRIECKEGWNPESVVHSICAFANDINNWGGGYIFIGVAEKDGMPQLPPAGIAALSIDGIQKELLNLSHQLEPFYAPVTQPYVINGRHILAIWVPGGDNRPYKAPTTLGVKGQKRYYVRRGSNTVLSSLQEERLLIEMAKRIPFDDRVNHQASINDLSLGLIREFLDEIKSVLATEALRMPLPELVQQMRIVAGPPEALLPLNVGLLFFSEHPEAHFPGARTDVVVYQDNTGREYTEKLFVGPIHRQLRDVLSFIQTNIVKERVTKIATKAEAERISNYPFAALEEVIANAFYHRSYELYNPIEINCWPDRIEVLSFPGPLPPVTRATLKQRRIVARNYRNRRVGDFLKELKLTEGRSTGFPTIYDSMRQNGSSEPVFDTDDDYGYFLAVLPVHHTFLAVVEQPSEKELQILLFCLRPQKRTAILKKIGITNHPQNYQRYIISLIERGWLAYTQPDVPTSPNQQYVTTEEGRAILG